MKKKSHILIIMFLCFILTGCFEKEDPVKHNTAYLTSLMINKTKYQLVANYSRPISAKYERQQSCKDNSKSSCYAFAYYKKIVTNIDSNNGGLRCATSSCLINDKYIIDNKGVFNEIVLKGRPVLANVSNSNTGDYWILLVGVKDSKVEEYKKSNAVTDEDAVPTDLKRSDFLIMDTYPSDDSNVFYNAASKIPYRNGEQYWTNFNIYKQ